MNKKEKIAFDALLDANVQWVAAYAALRLERDLLKKEAELGNIAMRFVDRAGDVAICDSAERICDEFYVAMSEAVERLYVQQRDLLIKLNKHEPPRSP
jgi:hypothetical protein